MPVLAHRCRVDSLASDSHSTTFIHYYDNVVTTDFFYQYSAPASGGV